MTLEGSYYHVRFRDPDEFEQIPTPDWVERTAAEVSPGSHVRVGERRDGVDWEVVSVLIDEAVGESAAREQATAILEEIGG